MLPRLWTHHQYHPNHPCTFIEVIFAIRHYSIRSLPNIPMSYRSVIWPHERESALRLKTRTSIYIPISLGRLRYYSTPCNTRYRTLSLPHRHRSMGVVPPHTLQKPNRSIIRYLRTRRLRNRVNYSRTCTPISINSISRHCDSLPFMDQGVGPIWHHTNLYMPFRIRYRFNNMGMGHRHEIIPTLVILSVE